MNQGGPSIAVRAVEAKKEDRDACDITEIFDLLVSGETSGSVRFLPVGGQVLSNQ